MQVENSDHDRLFRETSILLGRRRSIRASTGDDFDEIEDDDFDDEFDDDFEEDWDDDIADDEDEESPA